MVNIGKLGKLIPTIHVDYALYNTSLLKLEFLVLQKKRPHMATRQFDNQRLLIQLVAKASVRLSPFISFPRTCACSKGPGISNFRTTF